jgi:hypothetical protein
MRGEVGDMGEFVNNRVAPKTPIASRPASTRPEATRLFLVTFRFRRSTAVPEINDLCAGPASPRRFRRPWSGEPLGFPFVCASLRASAGEGAADW